MQLKSVGLDRHLVKRLEVIVKLRNRVHYVEVVREKVVLEHSLCLLC